MIPRNPSRSAVWPGSRREAEQVEPDLGLPQAVEQDRANAQRDDHDVREPPARFEQPTRERTPADATVLIGQGVRGKATQQPEPDREHLGIRPPGIAPELGHHGQREGGVADEDHEEDAGSALDDELEPHDDQEPDRRRPRREPGRVLGHVPRADAEPMHDRGTEVMERRERIEELPDRPDERRQQRDAHPAVDPQDEGRDLGVGRAAEDPLDARSTTSRAGRRHAGRSG